MSTGTGQIRLAARERDVVHPMEGQEGLTVSAVVLAPDDAALVRVHDVPGGVDPGLQVVDLKRRRPRHHHPQHCSDHHLHREDGFNFFPASVKGRTDCGCDGGSRGDRVAGNQTLMMMDRISTGHFCYKHHAIDGAYAGVLYTVFLGVFGALFWSNHILYGKYGN